MNATPENTGINSVKESEGTGPSRVTRLGGDRPFGRRFCRGDLA